MEWSSFIDDNPMYLGYGRLRRNIASARPKLRRIGRLNGVKRKSAWWRRTSASASLTRSRIGSRGASLSGRWRSFWRWCGRFGDLASSPYPDSRKGRSRAALVVCGAYRLGLRGMRYRPSWEAKRKRGFKQPGKPVPSAMLARRSSFGDFSEGTGRRQCAAMSRQSGKRCRKDAVGGTNRCKTHGGVSWAVRKAMSEGRTVRRASSKSVVDSMKIRALCTTGKPLTEKAF